VSSPTDSPAGGAAALKARLCTLASDAELELPLLPDASAQVLALCGEESCDARALAQLLERDPALAAHVLRVSNSAAYAPREPIVSLQQAVSRLGMGGVRNIAVAVALQVEIFRVPGHEARLAELWTHSACAGAWAREIARARRRNAESAFLCGLLHDVGKPALLREIAALERGLGLNLDDAALEDCFDELHAELGARLLERWKLPARMVAAARFHHRPDDPEVLADQARYAEDVHTTALANQLAHWSRDLAPERLEAVRACPALEPLGLYAEDLEALMARRDTVLEAALALA
jgi:putative nucleotidyltransferase with HDIG domain